MTREDMELLAGLVRAGAGLMLQPDQAYLTETRLAGVAHAEQAPGVDGLLRALRSRPSDGLVGAVVEALANHETVFFRDRTVFDSLRKDVLPRLAAARPGGAVRVWSAACATGQEPYSLAMLAADLPGLQLDLCASDLSERCLEKARAGLYTHFEVQRGLPITQLLRWFEKTDEAWRVRPELRQMVRWRRFNLLEDMAPLGRFDLILCRNVLSHMTPDGRRDVLERLARALARDGVLVLGAAELVSEAPDVFEAAPGGRGLFRLPRSEVSSARC
jgi:chemotaxis protein methyltransferase CheR